MGRYLGYFFCSHNIDYQAIANILQGLAQVLYLYDLILLKIDLRIIRVQGRYKKYNTTINEIELFIYSS